MPNTLNSAPKHKSSQIQTLSYSTNDITYTYMRRKQNNSFTESAVSIYRNIVTQKDAKFKYSGKANNYISFSKSF